MAVNGKRKQEHGGNKEKDYSFPNDGKNSQKANSFGVNRKKKKPTHLLRRFFNWQMTLIVIQVNPLCR